MERKEGLMKKFTRILSCILSISLTLSAFSGFSVSADATQHSLPYVNNFGDGTFSSNAAVEEFNFTPQSSGVLVVEMDYYVADSFSLPDGMILIENSSGQKVAGWKAPGRGTLYPVVDGAFSSTKVNSGSWMPTTYAINIEIDLDNDKWSATVDKKWNSALTTNLSCNNAANVSKLKIAFPATGFYIDNLKIYKKVAATQTVASHSIIAGNTQPLGISYTMGSAADFVFSSDNTAVATVNSSGIITAVSGGTATITAKNEANNINFVYQVTVGSAAQGIEISGDSHDLYVGQSKQLVYSYIPDGSASETLSWTSDNTSVATVNSNGVITAGTVGGSATITVQGTVPGGTISDTCTVNVTVPQLVITGDSEVMIGGTLQLSAGLSVADYDPGTICWTITDNGGTQATIDTDGVVTAGPDAGTITVHASCIGGAVSTTKTIEIVAPADGLTIRDNRGVYELDIDKNTEITLDAVALGGFTPDAVLWTASDATVTVTPDQNDPYKATVVANSINTTGVTVTVSCYGGSVKDECTFYVHRGVGAITVSTLPGSDTVLDIGEKVNLTGSWANANTTVNTNTALSWRTGNHNVANVDGNGQNAVVTAVGSGETQIYYMGAGEQGSITITVNPKTDAYGNNIDDTRTTQRISFTEAKASFTDIADLTWAQSAIQGVAAGGIMKADSESSFGARRNIKRDEFVSVILKTLQLENETSEESLEKTFDDVDESNPYYAEIMKAVELGIIAGVSDTSFAPNEDITRQDLAVVIFKALEAAGIDTAIGRLDFGDKDSISEYAQKSVRVLAKMNIMLGDSNGNFNPLANATRAEAAVIAENIATNITGMSIGSGETSDGEVPEKFAIAVRTLYGLGILPDIKLDEYNNTISREAFSNYVRNFGEKPITVPLPSEDDITMGEAVKLIIEMTDNVALAEHYGAYPTGYFSLASSMGITYGLTGVQAYDKLTYGMAIQMLYNTLSVTPSVVNSVTSGGTIRYEYNSDCTVLTEYLEVVLKQGFVTADGFWSLNPGVLPAADEIVIDGSDYPLKNAAMDDYVGYFVNYYYSAEDDLILAIEKTSKSDIVVLSGTNITNFNSNTYYYEVDGKETKYQLDNDIYVVSNYMAELDNGVNMWPSDGDVVLVDSDGNKKFETVLIKRYKEIEVQVFNAEKEQLVTKTGVIYDIPEDVPVRIYSDGVLVDSTKVKSGSYATVVVDANNDVREIYLSTEKVKGRVTSYNSDTRLTTVSVDGEGYIVSNAMANRHNMSVGISASFIINFKGEVSNMIIEASTAGGSTTTQLGYLIKMRKLVGVNGDVYTAKILTEKGTVETIELIEECKVNRSRVQGDMREALGAYIDATGNYTEVTRQVIEYAVNTDKKITRINTAIPYANISTAVNFGDYKLHESFVGEKRFYSTSFEYAINVKADHTIMFNVPANIAEENDYNFTIGKRLENDTKYDIVVYNYEKNAPFADVIVVKQTRTVIPGICGGPGPEIDITNDPMYMVTKVTNEYHDDYGRSFDLVEYVNIETGATAKKIVADNALWTSSKGRVTSYDVGYGSNGNNPAQAFNGDLKPGDLFHMSENGLGEIGTVHKHFDASDSALVKGTGESGAFNYNYPVADSNDWRKNGKFFEGYPVASGEDYIITANSPSVIYATADRNDLKFYQKHAKHTKVYKVKMDGNSIEYEKSALESIVPSVNGNSKSVIYTSNTQLMAVIVYEQ